MIVVTGANGFIGANVVLALARRGEAVVHVDDYPSIRGRAPAHASPAAYAPVPAERRYPDTASNSTIYVDMHDLADWLEQRGAEVRALIHLGACSDTTVTDRDYVMGNNFEFSRTLWRWAARARRPFIYASSAATYGDGSQGYDDTADPAGHRPLNLYAQSKQRFDLWALEQSAAHADALHTPPLWAGLKFFNVYGPRERHKGRMASVAMHGFDQIREHGAIRLFQSYKPGVADGEQKRDFLYVDDAAAVVLHFLDASPDGPALNGLYNAGTGEARTFRDLALAVFAAMGREPRIDYVPMPGNLRGRYQYFTQARTAKLRGAGFTRPMHTLEQGAAAYVRWLEQNPHAGRGPTGGGVR